MNKPEQKKELRFLRKIPARLSVIAFLLFVALSACQKKSPIQPEVTAPPQNQTQDEPIQTLARSASEKVAAILKKNGASKLEIQSIENQNVFPAAAASYFENAFIAQLANTGIQKNQSDWKLKGKLLEENREILFVFDVRKNDETLSSDSVRIPNDQRLQNTLAQFQPVEETHDHGQHKEMPVPTPLVELQQIPLDVGEDCSTEPCSLLLLYSNQLVQRNWKEGSERSVPLPPKGLRSRSPAGRILFLQESLALISTQFASPYFFSRDLTPGKGEIPSRLPKPEAGLNSYSLSDGRFFDFAEFGSGGLAVIDLKNKLSIAEKGKLISSDRPVGGTLQVSPPYIYTSSPTLPGADDSIQKFLYKDGILLFEKEQRIEGNVYDIAITDLNRDGAREMLVTVRNSRGVFIEVYEPF